MKQCLHCKNYIDDNALFCPHCGYAQGKGFDSRQPPINQPRRTSSNNLLYFIIGILGTAVLFIGGFLAYNIFLKPKVHENIETVQTQQAASSTAGGEALSGEGTEAATTTEMTPPPPPPKFYSVVGSHHLTGSISKYGITMDLQVASDGSAYGSYYYHSVGSKHRMTISGKANGNDLYLEEYSPEGYNTGNFDGTFDGQTFSGKFINYEKRDYLSFSISE